MKEEDIAVAIAEAERFIKYARAAIRDLRDNERLVQFSGSKNTASCRRASLDLTRALAEMRRP